MYQFESLVDIGDVQNPKKSFQKALVAVSQNSLPFHIKFLLHGKTIISVNW
jgi:hypothetical protein